MMKPSLSFKLLLITALLLLFSVPASAEVPCFEGSWATDRAVLGHVIAHASEWTGTSCPQTLDLFPVQVSFDPFFNTGVDVVARDGELRIVCYSEMEFSTCGMSVTWTDHFEYFSPAQTGKGYSVFIIKGIDKIPVFIDLSCSYLPELDMFASGRPIGELGTDRVSYCIELRDGKIKRMEIRYQPVYRGVMTSVLWVRDPYDSKLEIMVQSPDYCETHLAYDLTTGVLTDFRQVFDMGD